MESKVCFPTKEHMRRISASQLESEDVDSIFDQVDADGAVLIDDERENCSFILLSMATYTEILKISDPDTYQEKIKEIEEACQEYCKTHSDTE